MKNYILIVAYYSFKDPVFKSAVLPYFRGLHEKIGIRFVLITFEQKKFKLTAEEEVQAEAFLKHEAITWYRLSWHSGRFKLFKKIIDLVAAFANASYIAARYNIRAVYSEGFPGAVIGHYLAKVMGKPHIVHTFEPHTDYMVESGVWKANSQEAKLLKRLETTVAKNAHVIMTATDGYIEKIKPLAPHAQFYRIPSCVDTALFKFNETERANIRERLGVQKTDCLMVYLGKVGGMYMDTELAEFFDYCARNSTQVKFKFLILTPDDRKGIEKMFRLNSAISANDLVIESVKRENVYKYLSAADFGFVAVKQKPSKRFCSPIKDGEYWSCGLPIIIPDGISDDYIFATQFSLGIVMKDTTPSGFSNVLNQIESWHLTKDQTEIRTKCRNFAEYDRSIERYQKVFYSIFQVYAS